VYIFILRCHLCFLLWILALKIFSSWMHLQIPVPVCILKHGFQPQSSIFSLELTHSITSLLINITKFYFRPVACGNSPEVKHGFETKGCSNLGEFYGNANRYQYTLFLNLILTVILSYVLQQTHRCCVLLWIIDVLISISII